MQVSSNFLNLLALVTMTNSKCSGNTCQIQVDSLNEHSSVCKNIRGIISLLVHTRTLRHREVKCFVSHHKESKSQDATPASWCQVPLPPQAFGGSQQSLSEPEHRDMPSGKPSVCNCSVQVPVCRTRFCSYYSREREIKRALEMNSSLCLFPESSLWEENFLYAWKYYLFILHRDQSKSASYTRPNTSFSLFCMELCCSLEKRYHTI